ncbi:hypothetical protein LCGC14_0481500 [marine sediment metagenome]|uniref:HNH nuclease domain-containing protein n=1 Tax=marine sediment metagenome TaxID=412755 RepID=A0A0F9S955_9ZZZZ
MTDKQCVGCGNYKKRAQFYKSKSTYDGLNRYCKGCCKVNRALEAVRKRDKKSKVSMRQIHRAQHLGVECDHSVKLVEVFKKYFGICGICEKWVQPKQASMDHIYPLSKGGGHIYDNIQLSHLLCNLRKGNRT